MKIRFKQQGQGLIETLVVMLIVSISVVAIFQFINYLNYSGSLTRQQSDANLVAIQQIETLRNFSVLNTTAGYVAYQGIASGSASAVTISGTSYTPSWTVTTTATPPYKVINMSVAWTDTRGANQSITLVTYVAGVDPGAAASFM